MTELDGKSYLDFFDEISSDKKKVLLDLQELVIKNIDHFRSFISTLLTIDIAVIGAVLAIYSSEKNSIIYSPKISGFGMILLFVDAVLIVYYSTKVLVKENEDLTKRRKFFERSFSDVQSLAYDYVTKKESYENFSNAYIKKGQAFSIEEKELVKESEKNSKSAYFLYILSILFIIGISLIGLSFLHVNLI